MLIPDGYTLQKTLAASPRSEVVLALRDADRTTVVLKSYHGKGGTRAASRIEREFAALRACSGPGVPRAYEILRERESLLALEYLPGVPLGAWVAQSLPSTRALLAVAIQLSEVLARLHKARLIHRDIGPYNVLVEPQSLRTHLIDFGLAQPLGAQSHTLDSSAAPGDLTRALHYIAPEQTGRMNRGIDTRSDLYCLGATLFLVATGRTPFSSNDPLALLHAHMARIPEPATSINPDLPETLSRIIAKLLEKEPGERYQSASGLQFDLRWCGAQLEAHGRMDPSFSLGSAELPDRPRFGSTLYGRELEVARMRERYAQAAQGRTQILMLAGEPGTGKSALVDELRRDFAASSGYLAIGKFDLSQDRPYAGWCHALGRFVQQLLVESDARLEAWRGELQVGLGNVARVMVDLVPDLGFVLRETTPIPVLGPRETQARLALALQRFLAVCATPEHPLVLFLDDLQWSDAASRSLLEDLFANPQPLALLLLGAYRANEVDAQHPLAGLLSRLEQQLGAVEILTLGPLSVEATVAMLAEALDRAPEEVRGLAGEIERKTGNAPLLVRQFVEHIHSQGILDFVVGAGWQWDPAAITAANIPDGAVALMSARLHRLAPRARSVVELASCVGDEFDVELLAELSGRALDELTEGLFGLADAGLITPCSRGFRFVHDRVREAARALLEEEARAVLHAGMARLLLQRLSDEELEGRIFEIAEHQTKGLPHLCADERVPTFQLQLRAGQRALAAGAASTAEAYLATARSLLHEDDWDKRQVQAVDLLLSSAESAFLRGDLEGALAHIEILEQHSLSLIQQAKAEAQRIQIFSFSKEPDRVAAHTIAVLRRLGASWPLHPSRLRMILDLQWLRLELWLRGVDRVFLRAKQVDPRRMAMLLIVGQGAVTLSRIDGRILALLACWATRQNLRFGYVTRPAYSLAAAAIHFFLDLGATETGNRLHEIALEYNRRDYDPIFGPRTEFHSATALRPWQMRRRKALAPLDVTIEAMREAGQVEFAYYTDFLKLTFCALAGDPVLQTEAKFREQVQRLHHARHVYVEPQCCHQAYSLLAEPDPDAIAFEQRIAEGEATIALGNVSAETFARSVWIMVLCIYARFDLAFAQSQGFFPRLFGILTHIHVADHVFFRGIAAAELATHERGRARQGYRRALTDCLHRLRHWERQRGGPDFGHMVLLLEAERLRLAGSPERARQLYDRAVKGAEQHAYPHHAALAAERRGGMLLQLRQFSASSLSLSEAIRRYRDWGCEAKALALERSLAERERTF